MGSYHYTGVWNAISTDMGNISALVPIIHFYTAVCEGTLHGNDFNVCGPYSACVPGTKAEIGIIRELLSDGAKNSETKNAEKIISEFKPVFASVDEYLAHKRSMTMKKDAVIYNEDGTVTLDYKNN